METSDTNPVLEAVSRTFNEGIYDRTAVVLTVTAVLILFILLSVILRLRARKRTIRSSEASFQQLIRKHNLTIRELDLLDRFSETLRKKEEKYHLLIHAGTLRQAAKKSELSEEEELIFEKLKTKLGFNSQDSHSEVPHTSELEAGTPLKVFFTDGETGDAEVYSIAESGITIKYRSGQRPVIPDEEITLMAPADGMLRLFILQPDRVKGELFSAPHRELAATEKMDRKIGIFISVESGTGSNSGAGIEKKAVLLKLDGDKAVISMPPPLPLPGSKLSIQLDNDRKKSAGFPAEVMKISEEKQMIAVNLPGGRNEDADDES